MEAVGNTQMIREPILPTLFFFFTFLSISTAADTLTLSHPLSVGETLISANGTFTLGFFSPPSTTNRYLGIWYHNLSVQTFVWVANRRNPILNLNATLSITADDASLHIITPGNSTPIWSSSSFPNSFPNPIAQLMDSGNLIVKNPNSSSILWQSFDYPTDTMLPDMKLGPDLKNGIDRSLTAWRSPTDPSPGNYTLAIDPTGIPQLVIRVASGNWLWRGGAWNGHGFVGAGPNQYFDETLFQVLLPRFYSSSEEIYYIFKTVGNATSQLTVDHNGTVRRSVWQVSSQKWNTLWLAPRDACDFFATCGANSVCDVRSSPMCICLDGFDPRNPVSWGKGEWSDGCVRSAALDCEANGTDEFAVVRGAKLPDTTEAAKDTSLDLAGCKARCLMNCSCKAYASAEISHGGNGCVIWTAEIKDLRVYENGGQDLFFRVASLNKGSKRKLWVSAVIAAAIALFLVIILLSFLMIRRRRRKKFYEERAISSLNWGDEIRRKIESGKEGNSEISLFNFTQVVSATNNFSDINKLGEGGFGPVYKGKLSEGQDVAIKRLSARSGQGLEEFKNEILLIARLQHRNLVRLLGCCIYGEEKMLIYEFMPNKSLDLLLFNAEQGTKLDWTRRFHIVEGIAQGLLYLHKHSRLRVIHRDLKASNILLDAGMYPKISDFGMARIFDATETQASTRRIVGTYGYMSPEYAFKGLFSVKSDVFSFGVLLLEIVSGKRNAGFHEIDSSSNLLSYAWELWQEETWVELVDPALRNQFRHDEVARCIYVALLCVQHSSQDRPDMSDVVTMLTNESLCFNSLKHPAFFSMKIATDSKWPFNLHVNNTSNDLSVSIIAGR